MFFAPRDGDNKPSDDAVEYEHSGKLLWYTVTDGDCPAGYGEFADVMADEPVKRGRGRPKKEPTTHEPESSVDDAEQGADSVDSD